MKRFWHSVTCEDSVIRLDGRPVKTPAGQMLAVPGRARAEAIADEWRAVEGHIIPEAMPMTGYANATIDRIAPDRAGFVASIAAYAGSDLLCQRADGPGDLISEQRRAWDPILRQAERRYGIVFELGHGVMPVDQPAETVTRLEEEVMRQPLWRLAGLANATTIGGSLIVALALAERTVSAHRAFRLTHLDELWQARHWGEDTEAEGRRDTLAKQFDAAARWMHLD